MIMVSCLRQHNSSKIQIGSLTRGKGEEIRIISCVNLIWLRTFVGRRRRRHASDKNNQGDSPHFASLNKSNARVKWRRDIRKSVCFFKNNLNPSPFMGARRQCQTGSLAPPPPILARQIFFF